MKKKNIVALITPMNKDKSIDYSSLKNIIDYHIYNKTSSILICGTTGESHSLSSKEKEEILDYSIDYIGNRIPLILGVGENSIEKTVLNLKKFANKKNIKYFMLIPPSFVLPDQNGLYLYYKTIVSKVDFIKYILYNNPKRTVSYLLNRTILNLSKIENIVGIKDSICDFNELLKLKKKINKKFLFFCGEDKFIFKFLLFGGNGVISVISNIAAKTISNICKLIGKSHFKKAKILFYKIKILYKYLKLAPNPSFIKWICMKLNLIKGNYTRLPIVEINEKYYNIKKYETLIKIIKLNIK
ncbi:MAG: 4-hydroxy-tetrahydrodipicolinate synthase [Enterobacteriaceae bacterium]